MKTLLLFLFTVLLVIESCSSDSFSHSSVKVNNAIGINSGASTDSSWDEHFEKSEKSKRYVVIAAPGMEDIAKSIESAEPNRFLYIRDTLWNKFPDGTDNIEIGGFHPMNRISGQNVLFLSSFHNNEVTLSQFSVLITLLQSFIHSLTIVLPFYPVGTMERVLKEGQVATANTYAQMFSNLPTCGKPTRVIVYDLHTLQNRFSLSKYIQLSVLCYLYTVSSSY